MRTVGHLGETQTAEFTHRHHHVFERRELEHQKVKLKHEANVFAASCRAGQVIGIGHFTAVNLNFAAVGLVKKA